MATPSPAGDANNGDAVQKILTQYIETTMRRREEGCHEAVRAVYGVVSALKEEVEVERLVVK